MYSSHMLRNDDASNGYNQDALSRYLSTVPGVLFPELVGESSVGL